MTSTNQLSKPRKNEERIGSSDLKETIESDGFYTMQKVSEGSELFYFRAIGDYVKGFLLGRQTLVLTHRKQVVYRMKVQEMRQDGEEVPVEENQVVEFPGLKYLRRVIDKNELIGSLIRVVYIGRQKTGLGHSAKVFDVFKDLGTYGVTSSRKESYQNGSTRKYKKRARTKPKPGGKRRARQDEARVPAEV